MIAIGCTCKDSFTLPYDKKDIQALYITYRENGKIVVEKELADCEFSDGHVSVLLTQEDTLKFSDESIVQIQIRIKLADGSITKSKVMETYTDVVLKKDVI